MKTLDSKLLNKFLKTLGERLTGDWVLIGGTVLPALGETFRSTTDIDLVGLGSGEMAQTLALMELAEALGLPVESINQAGSLFLNKISDFKEHLVVLHHGSRSNVFRPDGTLYLLLKVRRLSESDLTDCEEWLKWCKKNKETVEVKRVISAVQSELKHSEGSKALRLQKLLGKLEVFGRR